MTEELDELNRLFTSKNAEDVIKFYDHFDTAEQLIEWMKNRPSAPMKIYEVEGEKDIVVVIPTANHEGEFAKNCANNIFKGQRIVFVESNGPFFNYARSCNYGLKYALKYNPKWIVLSNDDMEKVDGISKLRSGLSGLDYNENDIIFASGNSRGRDINSVLVKYRAFFKIYIKIRGGILEKYNSIAGKFNSDLTVIGKKRFNRFSSKLFYKKIKEFYGIFDFVIFSSNYIKSKSQVFDPTFINGGEDHFLSYTTSLNNVHYKLINFDIKSIGSQSVGKGDLRIIRNLVGLLYFNYIMKLKYL
jgi:hypothetical protein